MPHWGCHVARAFGACPIGRLAAAPTMAFSAAASALKSLFDERTVATPILLLTLTIRPPASSTASRACAALTPRS